jgi:multicomponent Na+:H+ antiporter subunit G
VRELLTAGLLLVGATVGLLAAVGVLRMPDVLARMQAATKAAALGTSCLLLAVAVYFGALDVTVRAGLIVAFIFLTSPVSAHVLARAAFAAGVPLWEGTNLDDLRQPRRARAGEPPDDEPADPSAPGAPEAIAPGS